jgi:hypothetical protein
MDVAGLATPPFRRLSRRREEKKEVPFCDVIVAAACDAF